MTVCYYIIYTNLFDRPSIKATYVKLTTFLLFQLFALNTIVHN